MRDRFQTLARNFFTAILASSVFAGIDPRQCLLDLEKFAIERLVKMRQHLFVLTLDRLFFKTLVELTPRAYFDPSEQFRQTLMTGLQRCPDLIVIFHNRLFGFSKIYTRKCVADVT